MTANERGRLAPIVNIATLDILLHPTFLRLTLDCSSLNWKPTPLSLFLRANVRNTLIRSVF